MLEIFALMMRFESEIGNQSLKIFHPMNNEVIFEPGGWFWLFCVEFTCFPCACVGFFLVLQFPPTT